MADLAAASRNQAQYLPQSREQKVAAANARWAKQGMSALSQASELQQCLHKAGLAMSEDVSTSKDKAERARAAAALAGVSKGWQSMNDQVRILKGKPLPGSLRPSSEPKRKAKSGSVAPLPDTASVLPLPVPVPVPVPVPTPKESL